MIERGIRNIKIRKKLFLLGIISIVGMIILGSESIITAQRINQVGRTLTDTWLNAVILSEELTTDIANYRIQEMQYSIADNEVEKSAVESRLTEIREEMDDKFTSYKKLQTSNRSRELISQAEQVWNEYLGASDSYLSKSNQGSNNSYQILSIAKGESQQLFIEVGDLLNQNVTLTKGESMAARNQADHIYQNLINQKLVVIVLCSIMVVVLVIAITQSIENPANELSNAAHRATNGNLDFQLTYKSKDEIGNLTEAMNVLLKRVRRIVEDQKYILHEICKGNYRVKSTCEKSYRGDFAPLLYSVTCLQSLLRENEKKHEEEISRLKEEIEELESKIEGLDHA